MDSKNILYILKYVQSAKEFLDIIKINEWEKDLSEDNEGALNQAIEGLEHLISSILYVEVGDI